MKHVEAEIDGSIESRELAEASLLLKSRIEDALEGMSLEKISHVDVIFFDSAEGNSPSMRIRRVPQDSEQKTMNLYSGIHRVVRYDADELREIRRKEQ